MSTITLVESESTSLLGLASESTTIKPSLNSLRLTCEFRVVKTRGAILVQLFRMIKDRTCHFKPNKTCVKGDQICLENKTATKKDRVPSHTGKINSHHE